MNTLVQRHLAPTNDFQLRCEEKIPQPVHSSPPSEGEILNEEIIDYSDATLKFISEMLMDEDDDLETNYPFMLPDSLALQATEKSLYDALTNDLKRNPEIEDDTETVERNTREKKKNRYHEYSDVCETFEGLEMYDNVVLDGLMQTCGEIETKQTKAKKKSPEKKQPKGGPNRRGGKKKQDVVDLQSLLTQCAQSMADFDHITVNELFVRIRQHASPQGDGNERLAYYFANGLEARLSGTGPTLHAEFSLLRMSETTSAANILKAYKSYITAFPLKTMSHLMANKAIEKLASGATALHIVDFGIRYGHQWPSLIQALSERHGGPPRLRITGVECPQPGFGPAETVSNTGLRLAKYCKRFGVPFEYNAIAKPWETVRPKDVKINKNECLVVNCLYRLHNVLDEMELDIISPRDVVLNLMRSINPDMFIHGIDNGTYSTPFFVARFKEALFHFASLFDMFEATMPREDGDRQLVEQVYGSDAINIIACEGVERIQRPNTYKQWQARHLGAGFRQLPFDPMIVKYVRSKVEKDYHKAFSVDEDGKWVLHGWKGRVHSAISCWQPCPYNRSSC